MGIFSSIKRSLFGGKAKSQSQSTTDTTKNETVAPYAPVVPSINTLIGDLDQLYGAGGAPQISGYEQQGLDMLRAAATSPGAIGPAVAENNKVLSGAYLTPETNPYLADIVKRVGAGAASAINATFGGKGRTGSGLHQNVAAEGVANAAGELLYQNYGAERARMDAAAGRAAQLEAGRLIPGQALTEAGQSISARPFDIAAQRASILGSIARLGQNTTGTTNVMQTGKSSGRGEQSGAIADKIYALFS